MVVQIDNYSGDWKVVSLALDERTYQILAEENVPFIFVSNRTMFFLPEEHDVEISEEIETKFKECHNFDVFQIDETGKAYLFYSNESMDNAIITTSKCNSNCIMCPVADVIRKREGSIEPDKMIASIKHIPSDAVHLTVTGGEPFLIGVKIFDVLQTLKCQCPETNYLLLTNGRALSYKAYIDKFCETAPTKILIGIPLHGYNAETHDFITRSQGGFMQTCKGIKNLLHFGFQVELRIVVSKLNCHYIDKICELIVNEFPTINSVKVMGLEMLGNAAKNREQVWISYPEAFQAAKLGIDILIKNGIDVAIYNFPLCAVEKEYHYICRKSITDYKIRFAMECEMCSLKDACGGIFAGTIRLAKKDVKAWE